MFHKGVFLISNQLSKDGEDIKSSILESPDAENEEMNSPKLRWVCMSIKFFTD